MASSTAPPPFPPPYIVPPSARHKYTIIALHGRGSTGKVFAKKLFLSSSTSCSTVPCNTPGSAVFRRWLSPLDSCLQNTRIILPTAPTRHIISPGAPYDGPSWFDVTDIADLEVDQQTQMDGLRESVAYVRDLIGQEIQTLEAAGRGSRDLFLLGRSQGSSVLGWAVLTGETRKYGGLVLAGSWLVFARALAAVLAKGAYENTVSRIETDRVIRCSEGPPVAQTALDFVRRMLPNAPAQALQSPVLMGHSVDDQWIDVGLGRQYRDVLRAVGFQVDWREYVGAEEEGHWLKEPEELDTIAEFWARNMEY